VLVPRDTSGLYSVINDTISVVPLGGTMAVNDTVHDFGSVDHVQQETWEFIITNEGNGILTLDTIYTSSAWYSVSDPSVTVPAQGSATVLVHFQPDLTPGTLPDTLVITSDDLDNPERRVPLSGSSLWPVVELSAAALEFGNVRVQQSKVLSVTLSNTGTDTLFVDSIYVLDENAGFVPALVEGRTSGSLVARLKNKGFKGFSSIRLSSMIAAGHEGSKDQDENTDTSKDGILIDEKGKDKEEKEQDLNKGQIGKIVFAEIGKQNNKSFLQNNKQNLRQTNPGKGNLSTPDLSRLVLSTEIYPGEFWMWKYCFHVRILSPLRMKCALPAMIPWGMMS